MITFSGFSENNGDAVERVLTTMDYGELFCIRSPNAPYSVHGYETTSTQVSCN
jgi:hypothetical protein